MGPFMIRSNDYYVEDINGAYKFVWGFLFFSAQMLNFIKG